MGHQVIRQPDGQLAVWSTVVDDFVIFDATTEEIAEHYAEEARKKAREDWAEACKRALETGTSGRYQFAMQWEEAQEQRASVHGAPFDLEKARAEQPPQPGCDCGRGEQLAPHACPAVDPLPGGLDNPCTCCVHCLRDCTENL
jgi:hypothetical protein